MWGEGDRERDKKGKGREITTLHGVILPPLPSSFLQGEIEREQEKERV